MPDIQIGFESSKGPSLKSLHNNTRVEVDSEAWYDDLQVTGLLEKDLGKDAKIASPIVLNNTQYDGLDDDARNNALELEQNVTYHSISDAIAAAKEGNPTAMPINSNGNHWTGGVMVPGKNPGDKPRFFYNDSMGNEMPEELREAMRPEVEIIDLKVKQQNNEFDCGPFAVENMKWFFSNAGDLDEDKAKKRLKEQQDAIGMRLDHVTNNPELFDNSEDLKNSLTSKSFLSDKEKIFEGQEVNRDDKGNLKSIVCKDREAANDVIRKMKEACDKLGIPSSIEEGADGPIRFVMKMPPGFTKDPFSMNEEELQNLQEAVAAQKKEAEADKDKNTGNETDQNNDEKPSKEGRMKAALEDVKNNHIFDALKGNQTETSVKENNNPNVKQTSTQTVNDIGGGR